jgi:putative tricarboxylic transport membrane protein
MADGLFAFATDPLLLAALLLAVPCGLVAGAIPGVGGKLSIVIALPFLLGIEPLAAGVFLLAMHSVIHTGGPIPSILLGVPGSGPDAATVLDGHPMSRRGEAHRALGAALGASLAGGLIGVAFLAAFIPFSKPLLYALGPPERFLLAVLGITFIASLSDGRLLRGLASGCLGLLVAAVGMDPISGVVRYAGDMLFLWDGVDMITAVIAVFAVPEILQLLTADPSPAGRAANQKTRLTEGLVDVWRHRLLVLRASALGALVGIVPGLGGEAASWMAYGHAVNSSKNPDTFGEGRVEGVLAPEAANNSKEGGSLVTTLLVGLPSSSGMTILLGAFLTLGIVPGPGMLGENIAATWTLVWALVFANLASAAIFVAGAGLLVRVTRIPGRLLFPFTLALALSGSFLSAFQWQTFAITLLFGMLGLAMKRCKWARAPFALGLILGRPAEIALYQSLTIWGPGFLLRAGSLVLLAAIAISLAAGVRNGRRYRTVRTPVNVWLSGSFVTLFAGAGLLALRYPAEAGQLPLAVAALGFLAVLFDLVPDLHGKPHATRIQAAGRPEARREWRVQTGWLLAFTATASLLGLSPGLPLLTGCYLRFIMRMPVWRAIMAAALMFALFESVLGHVIGLSMFRGLLFGVR